MRDRLIGPPADQDASGLGCLVHGCPLPGTWSNSTTGGPKICYVHDGMDPSQWPATTTKIRGLDRMLKLTERMLSEAPNEPVPPALLQSMRQAGFGDAVAMVNAEVNTSRKFGYALRKWLAKQCRPEVIVRKSSATKPEARPVAALIPVFEE